MPSSTSPYVKARRMSDSPQTTRDPLFRPRIPNPLSTPQQINVAVYRGWLRQCAEFPEWRWDLEMKADHFYFDRKHREDVNGR